MTNLSTLSKADLTALATLILRMQSKAPKQASKKPVKTSKKAASPKGESRSADFAKAAVEAAEAAGFTNNVPNETLLTYGRWEAKGREVKAGQKAIRVKLPGVNGSGLPLFHIDQTVPAGSPDGKSSYIPA